MDYKKKKYIIFAHLGIQIFNEADNNLPYICLFEGAGTR